MLDSAVISKPVVFHIHLSFLGECNTFGFQKGALSAVASKGKVGCEASVPVDAPVAGHVFEGAFLHRVSGGARRPLVARE